MGEVVRRGRDPWPTLVLSRNGAMAKRRIDCTGRPDCADGPAVSGTLLSGGAGEGCGCDGGDDTREEPAGGQAQDGPVRTPLWRERVLGYRVRLA